MGPVAQLVFKTSAVVQPTARSVRLRRRSVDALRVDRCQIDEDPVVVDQISAATRDRDGGKRDLAVVQPRVGRPRVGRSSPRRRPIARRCDGSMPLIVLKKPAIAASIASRPTTLIVVGVAKQAVVSEMRGKRFASMRSTSASTSAAELMRLRSSHRRAVPRRVPPCGHFPTRSRPTAGRCRPPRRRGSPVSRRTRCCASTATRRRSLPRTRARRRSPTRSPRSSATRTAASPHCSTRSPSTPASTRSASCSEREPTICSCSAGARSPGRATSSACWTSRRTRSSASPRGSPVRTSATKARCSRTAAGRTTRRARSARCPTCARSSSTRRTSSTPARRPRGRPA